MVTVYVDNRAIPAPPATCGTLADLVGLVRRQHLGGGRIVQKLVVNGQNCFTFSHDYLDFVLNDPEQLRRARSIEVTSVATEDLTRATLSGAIEYCDDLLLGLQGIAQRLRAGQVQEGLHFYAAAMPGIASLMDLVLALEPVMGVDYTRFAVNGVSMRASLDGLAEKAQALVAAQERNDLVTMADVLEYDIHDTVGHWKLALQEFARGAAAPPVPAALGSQGWATGKVL